MPEERREGSVKGTSLDGKGYWQVLETRWIEKGRIVSKKKKE